MVRSWRLLSDKLVSLVEYLHILIRSRTDINLWSSRKLSRVEVVENEKGGNLRLFSLSRVH